jgi:hypothetical protein
MCILPQILIFAKIKWYKNRNLGIDHMKDLDSKSMINTATRAQCYKTFYIHNFVIFVNAGVYFVGTRV